MAHHTYNHFCPIAKASELLEPKWSMLLLSELCGGSARFNELRRNLPGMSPTLLSRRLKEMEAQGLVTRNEDPETGDVNYLPTAPALALGPILDSLGKWAHGNLEADVSLERLNVKLLMWAIMRKLDPAGLPAKQRTVILFEFPEQARHEQRHWLIITPGSPVEICGYDPGFDIDFMVTAELMAMTSYWMGYSSLKAEIDAGRIDLAGDGRIEATIGRWLVRSSYATD